MGKSPSMIRSYTWADLFTLANAACGTVTVFACLSYLAGDQERWLWTAFALPVLALVFDALDGWVARKDSRHQSVLGAELDSLADVVSFGVAPAVLAYTLGLRGFWDATCLTLFVCAGISRLARFNVTSAALTNVDTGKVRYFEGTPIPTSVVLVLVMAGLFALDLTGPAFPGGNVKLIGRDFHPFSLLFLLNGSLMISTIKVPKP